MPSARPRLVQEGTPLEQHGVVNNDGNHHKDHHMEDAVSRNMSHQPPADTPTRSSSLALAAGLPSSWSTGSLTRVKQAPNHSNRSHRYVVGGDDEMEIASDHHSCATTTPSNPHYATMPVDDHQQQHFHRPYYPPTTTLSSQQPSQHLQATPVSQLFAPVQSIQPHLPTTKYFSQPQDIDEYGIQRRHSDGTNLLPPLRAAIPKTGNIYDSRTIASMQNPWSHSHGGNNEYQHQLPGPHATSSQLTTQTPASSGRHHYQIGTSDMDPSDEEEDIIERMYGIEDHSVKPPLIVIDGANVAFAYAEAMAGGGGSVASSLSYHKKPPQIEPDVHGIQVAVSYFQSAGCRVLVVLPTWWLRLKPRAGDTSDNNAKMQTPQLEILQELKSQGVLVTSPPKDDDDAYALTIARREDARARHASQQYQQGPSGFVVSNDMFRDAMARDATGQLTAWLTRGATVGGASYPGGISFAFCDMGSLDGYGDPELDIVPNPKHPIVMQIEAAMHQQFSK